MKIYIIVGIMLVVLIGCTRYITQPVVNHTIYRETVIYNHTIEYINVSVDDCNCEVSNSSTRYILNLIRQIKQCESNIVDNWNLTECVWEIERLNKSLTNCNESLEDIRELLD